MASILVLDDVEDASVLLGKMLRRRGHSVHASTDEDEALEHARGRAVDLAILDINLKRMSGLEVLERLKGINPDMRAIMLTGFPSRETAEAALGLGADAYCVKPIDRAELEEKVERILASGQGGTA